MCGSCPELSYPRTFASFHWFTANQREDQRSGVRLWERLSQVTSTAASRGWGAGRGRALGQHRYRSGVIGFLYQQGGIRCSPRSFDDYFEWRVGGDLVWEGRTSMASSF